VALLPWKAFNLYMGNGCVTSAIHDWYGDNFDHSDLPFIGGAQIWSSTGERHPMGGLGAYPIGGGRVWGREWKEALRNQWNSSTNVIMEGDSIPHGENFLDLDPNYRASDGQPLLRITFDWHENDYNLFRFVAGKCSQILQQMGPASVNAPQELEPYNIDDYQSTHPTGGAIMGSDPGDSVTNSFGQVWDTPNVFVTGAALFPQNPGPNPTDTVAALAYRTGDTLRDRYFKNERRIID
jgi:gluconate 2-dehydrogenase alpha chain